MRSKTVLAVGLVIAAVGLAWAGRVLWATKPQTPEAAPSFRATPPLPRVTARLSTTVTVPRQVTLYGRTAPSREVTLRAEANGRILEIPVAKGTRVEAGTVLLRLDSGPLKAERTQAEAEMQRRTIELEQARKLNASNFSSRNAVVIAEAELTRARADAAKIAHSIAATEIRAPFDGILEDVGVEVGDYVSTGTLVGRMVCLNPLKIVAQAPESVIGKVRVGSDAVAHLRDGRTVSGRVSWISQAPATAPWSYKIQILATSESPTTIPGGLSTTLTLTYGTIKTHHISSALLTVGDGGTVGVKTIGNDNRVALVPVEVITDGPEGVYVAGLPDRVRLVTLGQGYVNVGERVEAVMDNKPPDDAMPPAP